MWNSEVLYAGSSAGNIEHLLCDTQYTVKQYNGLENPYLTFGSKAGIIEEWEQGGWKLIFRQIVYITTKYMWTSVYIKHA
jgi:hypothetical protein